MNEAPSTKDLMEMGFDGSKYDIIPKQKVRKKRKPVRKPVDHEDVELEQEPEHVQIIEKKEEHDLESKKVKQVTEVRNKLDYEADNADYHQKKNANCDWKQ